jgi:hypothetical protein
MESVVQNLGNSWYFWLFWGLAFLGFPLAGVLANLISAVTTPGQAILTGSIAGATIGIVQWFVLRSRLPFLPIWWIVATSIGMALGLSLSTAFLGTETAGKELLWRAVITGLCIGLAQWIVLRAVLPQSVIWIGIVGLGWVIGWFITRSIGVDLSYKWAVFGSAGALTFQFMTGMALYFLLRSVPKVM